MERIIALTASLPQSSKMRAKLSQTLVGSLWETLQHPPHSYYGEEHQYRTADGSNNVRCPFVLERQVFKQDEIELPVSTFRTGWNALR